MNIPLSVRKYLAQVGGKYRLRTGDADGDLMQAVRTARISPAHLARAVVVGEGERRLMVVFPASHTLDLDILNCSGKYAFQPLPKAELEQLFGDCDTEALPPLGALAGLNVVVDKALDLQEELFFPAGRMGQFIRTSRTDFDQLLTGALRGRIVARPLARTTEAEAPAASVEEETAVMRRKVETLDRLPPMPGIAAEIIRLRNNPYAHISELASVIEQDPGLSAQVIRYAASPFYGYQGKVDSVALAITRVLGMDFVMDLAFGLSLGRSFRNPQGGPLGLDAFWQHATHTAALTQALCSTIDYCQRPSTGTAYLAGLLHNFGFLLLGHLFPEQFARLNAALQEAPDTPIQTLEYEVLGLSHTDLGLWLMEAWEMPREIVEAVREHHNPEFGGDYAVYPKLVYIANQLLKRHGIGDAEGIEIDERLLAAVGLDAMRAEAALGSVVESRDHLEFMASRMAA